MKPIPTRADLLRALTAMGDKESDTLAFRDPPTQEADGHFRGCPRLGQCHCLAGAPRDEWRPDDAP